MAFRLHVVAAVAEGHSQIFVRIRDVTSNGVPAEDGALHGQRPLMIYDGFVVLPIIVGDDAQIPESFRDLCGNQPVRRVHER